MTQSSAVSMAICQILTAAAFAIVVLTSSLLHAQESNALDRGDFVRITGLTEFRFQGTFLARDDTALYVQREGRGDSTSIPIPHFQGVERRVSRHSQAGHGALIGGSIGALLGLGLIIGASTEEDSYCCTGGEYASGVVVLAGVGAGLGALIGAASHADTWAPVSPEAWQVHAAAAP